MGEHDQIPQLETSPIRTPHLRTNRSPNVGHICIVTPYALTRVSGISQMIRELGRVLAQSGIDVIGWCPAPSMDSPSCRIEGIQLRSRIFRDLELAIRTASRILRTRHAIGLVHAHQFHLQSAAALFASRLIGRGAVLTIHVRTNVSSPFRRSLQRLVEWLCFHWADATTAVSAPVAISLRKHDVVAIQNGVDIDVFKPSSVDRALIRNSLGLGSDKVVVFSGRWSRTKGLDSLLAAFGVVASRYPKIHLLIIGEPALDEPPISPEAFADASTLDRIHVLGRLKDSADVAAHLSAADLFALPSLSEGMPLAVLEAMATGLPIVASDIDAHRALLEKCGCSWLVPPGDVEGLARVLERFVVEGAPREWSNLARTAAVDNYSAGAMTRGYQAVYADVLSKRAHHPRLNQLLLEQGSRPY
jgi:glycosyltransferase involved in cell wall biosynthesis